MTNPPVSSHTFDITGEVARIDDRADTIWVRITSPRSLREEFVPLPHTEETHPSFNGPYTKGDKVIGKARYERVGKDTRLRLVELLPLKPSQLV